MQNMMNTHFSNLALGQQPVQVNVVQQLPTWCEIYKGGDHSAEVCGAIPNSVNFVGNAQRGGGQQNYGNSYNPSWCNHPNFSWGGNQNQAQGQNQYRPQGNAQGYQPQVQWEQRNKQYSNMSMEEMLQFWQFASSQNSRLQEGLPGNTDSNPNEPNESEVGAQEEKVQPIVKPPPSFPQKFKKQKEDKCFGKFLSLLKQFHINLPLVDVLQGIPGMLNM
ncbi:hypothetical protein R3W88_033018 [Solanum pinnatisectum]|uniref:Uncharacterized protein n=1 Tax=Solanum pinnatisectum TaxID=50273 RepID=A0AAV9K2G3_9SOLN|nr:hypothetical protein R3W88_033018 [Solanum pinnatisectum]